MRDISGEHRHLSPSFYINRGSQKRNIVLIIDDKENVRKMLAMTMQRHGYDADVAPNAEEAIQKIREKAGEYAAIFVDQKLGVDDRGGLVLLEEIKSAFPDLPVVLFTAIAQDIREEALQKGAYAYLPKDEYSPLELLNLLSSIAHTNEVRRLLEQIDLERQWLQQIIDGLGDEVAVIDAGHNVLKINKTKKDNLNLTDECIGMKCFDAFKDYKCLGLGGPPLDCPVSKAIKSGKVEMSDWNWTDNNGMEHILNIIASPIKDETGNAIAVIESVRYVTKPRRMVELIEQIQNRQSYDVADVELLNIVADGLIKMGYDRARLYLKECRDGEWYMVGKVAKGMHQGFNIEEIIWKMADDPNYTKMEQEKKSMILTREEASSQLPLVEIHPAPEWLSSPVIVNGELQGLVVVDNKHSGEAITNSDKDYIEIITRSLGQALQINHQLFDSKQLSKIDETLTAETNLHTVYEMILSIIRERFNPDGIAIRAINKKSNKFIILHGEGYVEPVELQSLYPDQPIDVGVNGRVYYTKQSQFVVNAKDDTDFKNFLKFLQTAGNRDWIDRGHKVQSLAIGPLMKEDEIIGTLSMEFFTRREFTEREKRFFNEFCKKVSIALTKTEYVAVLEAKAIQSQKLSDLALISSGIAHQFNTPLQNIIGALTLLEFDNNPKHKQSIREEIDRMSNIIEALRDFAHPLSAEISPDSISLVNVERIIQRLITGYRAIFEEKQIECIVNIDEHMPPSPQNESHIEIILDNLIHNAIDAMSEGGGTLTIKSKYLEAKGVAILSVSDTGVGIPEKDIDKLFTPFYSTKHSLGMGLSLVLSLVNKLGGNIEVESQVGKGSTFTITLPWRKGEQK